MFSLREKRVGKRWAKTNLRAFAHRFPTLIHPLPTLRRGEKGVDLNRLQQLQIFLKYSPKSSPGS
jgi:hypothetical protein